MVVGGGVVIGVVVGVAAGDCPLAMASIRPRQANNRINVREAIFAVKNWLEVSVFIEISNVRKEL